MAGAAFGVDLGLGLIDGFAMLGCSCKIRGLDGGVSCLTCGGFGAGIGD